MDMLMVVNLLMCYGFVLVESAYEEFVGIKVGGIHELNWNGNEMWRLDYAFL